MPNETMRAVAVTAPGGPEALEIREVPLPWPLCGDRVLVRVQAAALNRADVLQRKGHYPAPTGAVADILGMEFAGEVSAVGDAVQRWKPGQRVFGITAGGAQAEYVLVPEDHLVEIPVNLDWTAAAAVPEAFITAHDAMFTRAGLHSGESVLVHAVGSGVGLAATQLAHAAGALVIGTSRTVNKLSRAREYGLDVAIFTEDDPTEILPRVLKVTNGQGANVIVDLVGGNYFDTNIKALASKGRLVLISTTAGAVAAFSLAAVMSKRLSVLGTVLRGRSAEEKATATRLFAEQVVPLLARGVVRPVIDSVFPLDQVRAAHERMESNESFGKVVLTLS